MLKLEKDTLHFSFPEIHEQATLSVTFQRTLRIPDDDKTYPLPPGLGNFPMKLIDEFRERVPANWVEHGGVMLPMYQSEALWISFRSPTVRDRNTRYPFAVKVATGKVSAVTGKEWKEGLTEKDYLVVPPQPWLDGYVVKEGEIRQFVAAPLGWGFTAEEQITEKAEHGGLQIEVFPMDPKIFDEKFPKIEHKPEFRSLSATRGLRRCAMRSRKSTSNGISADMGLAPGGKMKQQIFKDTHGLEAWKTSARARCFVHLANSLAWRAITGQEAPATPITAETYTNSKYPWFDHYRDDVEALGGSEKLAELKSVLEMGFQKGLNILPENVSVDPENVVVIQGDPGEVRVGVW